MYNYLHLLYIVTGDANFTMEATRLIVGGFNQPAVARCLIELPRNAEKGLSQRFLWLFPKSVYANRSELEPIDKKFYDTTGMTDHCMYTSDNAWWLLKEHNHMNTTSVLTLLIFYTLYIHIIIRIL